MDYYLNEYSLRGQFQSVEEFFSFLREYTLPVLDKIRSKRENVIWKKDTFWECEICEGISLNNIPKRKNERSAELIKLKMELIKLATEEPFWESDHETGVYIKEYKFDQEFRENFAETNCFEMALLNEGRIVSFIHPSYKEERLPVLIEYQDTESEVFIDNISEVSWWKKEPVVKTWRIGQKYLVEIRSNEFAYHPPHFHVSYNEFSAVFKLRDGTLYTCSNRKRDHKMISEISEWYESNKEELQKAWKRLHS